MRIPTTYSLHRAETGRFTSGVDTSDADKGIRRKKAQLHNVPKVIRDMIRAEPGKILVGGDLQAIEWVVFIWYAMQLGIPKGFHKALLDRFMAGNLDPHTYLASVCYSRPESSVPGGERQSVKPFTYGYLFDGAPTTLAREASLPDAVGVKVCKAHDEAFRSRMWKDQTVMDARKRHAVCTPLGWCRWFWAWNAKATEILGTLIQGTAADLMKWILLSMIKDPLLGWEILTTQHDAVVIMGPENERQKGMMWLEKHMTQAVPWFGGIQCRAKVKSGMTWRDVS